MRSLTLNLMFGATLALAASATGCKWTEFDDLENSTWVSSQTAPSNVDSADYATTVVRGQAAGSGTGSVTVVLGNSRITYSELSYDANGKATIPPDSILKLDGTSYDLPGLDGSLAIANPTSSDITIVASGGDGSIQLLTGTDSLNEQTINGPTAPLGAAYVTPPPAMGSAQLPAVMTAGVNGTATNLYTVNIATKAQVECQINDDLGMPATVAALAPINDTTGASPYDDILVLTKPTSGTAKLLLFPASVAVMCTGAQSPVASTDSTVDASAGADLRVLDTGGHQYAIVATHGDNGKLALFDLGTTATALASRQPVAIGTPIAASGLATIDLASFDGTPYLIEGFPSMVVDGIAAGQVQVTEIVTAPTGSDSPFTQPATMILNDAQPDDNQTFGRSVAAVPFGSATDPIIVVAAHNEVFTYFHTMLYADVRSN